MDTYTAVGNFAYVGNGSLAVSFYMDSVKDNRGNASYGGGIGDTMTISEQWMVDDFIVYEGLLSEGEIAWLTENNVSILPEPTALAFLALGVVGITLRRQMA